MLHGHIRMRRAVSRPYWVSIYATTLYITWFPAFGCTLSVDLNENLGRKYHVPMDYRGRGDAKAAVALQAEKEGAIEFVRFRGGAPPPDYDPLTYNSVKKPANNAHGDASSAQVDNNRKRKQSDTSDPPPLFETRAEAMARGRHLNKDPLNRVGGNGRPTRFSAPNVAESAPSGPISRDANSSASLPASFPPRPDLPRTNITIPDAGRPLPLGQPHHEEQSASASTSRFVPASPRDLVTPMVETSYDENRIPLTRTPDHVPAPRVPIREPSWSHPEHSGSPVPDPRFIPASRSRAASVHLSAGSPAPVSAITPSSRVYTRDASPASSSGRSRAADERYMRSNAPDVASYHDEPSRAAHAPYHPLPVHQPSYDAGMPPRHDDRPPASSYVDPYDYRRSSEPSREYPSYPDDRAVYDRRHDYDPHDRGYVADYHDPRYQAPLASSRSAEYPPPLSRHDHYDHSEYAPDYERNISSIPAHGHYEREESRRYDEYRRRSHEQYPTRHPDPYYERDSRAHWGERDRPPARYEPRDDYRQSYPPATASYEARPPPVLMSAREARSPVIPSHPSYPPRAQSPHIHAQPPPVQNAPSPRPHITSYNQTRTRAPTPPLQDNNSRPIEAYPIPLPAAPVPPAPALHAVEERGRTFEPRQGRNDQRSRSRAPPGERSRSNSRFQQSGRDKSRDSRDKSRDRRKLA